MRKIIVLNIFLVIILAVIITFACLEFQACNNWIGIIRELNSEYERGLYSYQQYINIFNNYQSQAVKFGLLGAFALVGSILCVLCLVMIDKGGLTAIKSISSAEWLEHKQVRAERKAAKASEQKQARITELERELEELKKDGE